MSEIMSIIEIDVEIEQHKPGAMPWHSCSGDTGQTVEVIALPANGERIEHRTWHMPRADLIRDGAIFFDSQGFPHRMRAFDDPRCVLPMGPAGLGSEPAPDCDRLSEWPEHCIVRMREHEWDEWRPVVRPDAFDDHLSEAVTEDLAITEEGGVLAAYGYGKTRTGTEWADAHAALRVRPEGTP